MKRLSCLQVRLLGQCLNWAVSLYIVHRDFLSRRSIILCHPHLLVYGTCILRVAQVFSLMRCILFHSASFLTTSISTIHQLDARLSAVIYTRNCCHLCTLNLHDSRCSDTLRLRNTWSCNSCYHICHDVVYDTNLPATPDSGRHSFFR
jgi:hypothetical protein